MKFYIAVVSFFWQKCRYCLKLYSEVPVRSTGALLALPLSRICNICMQDTRVAFFTVLVETVVRNLLVWEFWLWQRSLSSSDLLQASAHYRTSCSRWDRTTSTGSSGKWWSHSHRSTPISISSRPTAAEASVSADRAHRVYTEAATLFLEGGCASTVKKLGSIILLLQKKMNSRTSFTHYRWEKLAAELS